MEWIVVRPLGWIVRKVGLRTLASVALLLVVLGSVAIEIAHIVRELDAMLLLYVTIAGMLFGWILAKSPLPAWLAGFLAFVLGVEGIFLRVGRLGGALLSLLWTLFGLVWGSLRWWMWDGPPDVAPVLLALGELWAGLSTLLARMREWSLALAFGKPTFDPVAAALVWSLVLWAVSTWASWAVRRHCHPLQGVLPASALLAASFFYVGRSPTIFLSLLAATLLLMPLIGHEARERHWQMAGIDFSLTIRGDIAMVVIPLVVVLVTAAAIAPALSVRQIVDLAQRLTRGRAEAEGPVASSLGLEPQPAPPEAFDAARSPGLPRSHLLGSGPELSKEVVMIISTGDLPSGPPHIVLADSSPPRYYWQGLTYDIYTGQGWRTGGTETVGYKAGEPAEFGEARSPAARMDRAGLSETPPGRRPVRQAVQVVGDVGGLLFVAGNLVTADQDYSVAWRPPDDAFGANIGATTYRADSLVSAVSEEQLRSTGSEYSESVRNRYLALPDSVPARVRSLALDLTATAPTPYDRARAIETYLRAFTYTLDVPMPPAGQDVADYFLFDLKKGYCDYYATAMVVLARAAGLPARLAMGYASGNYDVYKAHYVVTEAQAHSWVEIYFPAYGWIEFEPTAGLPPIERPAETSPIVTSGPRAPLGPLVSRRVWLDWLWRLGLPGGLVLLVLGVVTWSVADGWRLRRLPPAAAAAVLYQRLYRHGQWLDVPVGAGDTPYEFSTSLAGRVTELAQKRRWGAALNPAVHEVLYLTDLYVRVCYSPHLPDATDRAKAIQTWRRLRRRLWLARV